MANLRLSKHVENRGAQPFFVAGLGLIRTRLEADDIFTNITVNDAGFTLGAGLAAYFSDHVGLQGDVRYFRAFKDADLGDDFDFEVSSFDFWRATIGLSIKF
jgi:opacity protein-like surface antigen